MDGDFEPILSSVVVSVVYTVYGLGFWTMYILAFVRKLSLLDGMCLVFVIGFLYSDKDPFV